MKETIGTVIDLKIKGLDFPTVVEVEYEVDGEKYTIKESLKLKSEAIKLGFLPIGQRKIPKVKCEKGGTVIVVYDEEKPQKGHIKGNDGLVNC